MVSKAHWLGLRNCYKKGVDNKVAYALSRLPKNNSGGSLLQLTSSCHTWLNDLVSSYDEDEEAKNIIVGVAAQDAQYSDYEYSRGIIKSQGRLFMGSKGDMRKTILWELHDSLQGGH